MSIIIAMLLAGSQPQLARVGDCGWARARCLYSNGSQIHRLYLRGSHHVLSLDIPDEGDGSAEDPFRHIYGRFTPFRDEIHGDFYVCARERRIEGHMQSVHFIRMKNWRIVHR